MTKIDDNISHFYDSLKDLSDDDIILFINNYFNEEEKIRILRNKEFINRMSSNHLTQMLNGMNFISVFNMIQNKDILDKVEELNVRLTPKDKLFFEEYLYNEHLINKINHSMLKNMLININKDDTIKHLNNSYIINKLTNEDIISIAAIKKIDLTNYNNIINKLSKNDIANYIDYYFKTNGFNKSLLNNVKNLIFDFDFDSEEVFYLYDLLTTKSNHMVKESHHSLSSFKAVLSLYKTFGFDESTKYINNSNYGLDDITINFINSNIENKEKTKIVK